MGKILRLALYLIVTIVAILLAFRFIVEPYRFEQGLRDILGLPAASISVFPLERKESLELATITQPLVLQALTRCGSWPVESKLTLQGQFRAC